MTNHRSTAPLLEPEMARSLMEIARGASGVALGPAKLDFVRGRLAPRLTALGCRDYHSYLRLLSGPDGPVERQHLIEALATHTTSFFRERRHFDWLQEHGLPRLATAGAGLERDLVIWSAACSTGAELWSAAMVVDAFEAEGGRRLRWQGIGSDISERILRHAGNAVFTEDEIEGIPAHLLRRYLMRSRPATCARGAPVPPRYKIVPELRTRCRLVQLNLLDLDAAPVFDADIVLLRNVLIYFSPDDQRAVVAAVARRIRPGGLLLTGHAEVLRDPVPGLTAVTTAIYAKKGPA